MKTNKYVEDLNKKSDAELATLVGEMLTAGQLEFNRSKVERICS